MRFLLRGYIRIHSVIHPAGEAKKLAFTIELVQYTRAAVVETQIEKYKTEIFIHAIQFALKFGIYFLLRKSEYLPGRSAGVLRKGLQWKNIRFFDKLGYQIPWVSVKFGASKSVEIIVPFSKTDPFGYGRLVKHARVLGPNCIVGGLEKWVSVVRVGVGASDKDYLFQYGKNIAILTDIDVAAVMKLIVVKLGWDASKISPHSLRYGGATMLAAAGFPQYVIASYGGWTEDSKSLRKYIQLFGASVDKVSSVMAQGFNKSLEDSRIRQCKGK